MGTTFKVGDKVVVCGDRRGVVEKTVRDGKERYYVRWFKTDGSPSKVGAWCHPLNLKAVV
jgi:uncharacterized protein YodC (DUF2158 family)